METCFCLLVTALGATGLFVHVLDVRTWSFRDQVEATFARARRAGRN